MVHADIICLQEVENEELTLPGYNIVFNVDHSRRGTAIALKDFIKFTHVEKSLDSRMITLRVLNTTIANVYAPSGTAMRAERERFLNTTLAYYLRHNTEHTVLTGDFNCVLRPCDATGHNHSPALQATIQQLQLHDVWQLLRSRDTGFTYITHNSSSRLDRVYVSTGLREQLRDVNTHVCSFTNHKAVTVRLCLPNLGREQGRGYWSLRPHLLTDTNVEEFQVRWQFWTRRRRDFTSWMSWWVGFAKPQIKKFFRWKSKEAYDNFYLDHQRLYARLKEAYDAYYLDAAVLPTINRIKGEMLSLQRRHTQMFVRINETYIAGEAISTFQLGEKKRKRTIITKIEEDHGRTVEDSEEIEQRLLQYFSDLYTERETAEPAGEESFLCPRVVAEGDVLNERTTSEISTNEILQAIKTSAARKSPGPDGIPKEFYARTFSIIHRELNLILNEALSENFPAEFVDGVIVLVKKKGPGNTVHSYRPISLLNFDYKLLSRILKTRLDEVMVGHRILTHAQKCSNADRNIFQATLALKDKIADLISRRERGKLVSFDLDHAFDRVSRAFLHRNMLAIGINPRLVSLLARISSLSSSRLLVNGHLSAPFPIQQSVRQGDPISMHLFVLYLHPLLRKLEEVCGEDLIVAYADDVSVVATSTEKIIALERLFFSFEQFSGAKLNREKTVSINVGLIDENALQVPWLQTMDRVKVLGVTFVNSIRLMITLNWDDLINRFARQVWLQSLRSLTVHQKVILLNTFMTSKIWYLSSILPPYSVHTSKITATMGSFLWRRMPARIPMEQLARDRNLGGLKLQLPAKKCKALLLNRHVTETESMPFYRSFTTPANPPGPAPPTSLPCLKSILENYQRLPPLIQQNPSADEIHRFYVNQTALPRVERNHPRTDWRKVWQNISNRQLTAAQRSHLYLLVNEKIEHRKLMFTIRRADGEDCTYCNAAVETLQHKFCDCPRVEGAWRHLQQRTRTILQGWRRLSFEDLIRPELIGVNRTAKISILKLFTSYVSFIELCNNDVDINALEFYLDSEV